MANTNEGSLALVPAMLRHKEPGMTSVAGELYQVSLMNALAQGVYEGDVTYGELRQHGDFGLGTFNGLDGEMVAIDGVFYQMLSDGSAHPVDPNQKAPFAVVTFFEPAIVRNVTSPMTKDELQKLITQSAEHNLFHAVRVDGEFASVTTRTVRRQQKPYPKLAEAAEHQQTTTFEHVKGSLAGFLSPAYAKGIGVPGFHLHFLRDDHLAGGHALDYVVQEGRVAIAPQHAFHVELPKTMQFESADLDDPAVDQAIEKAEG